MLPFHIYASLITALGATNIGCQKEINIPSRFAFYIMRKIHFSPQCNRYPAEKKDNGRYKATKWQRYLSWIQNQYRTANDPRRKSLNDFFLFQNEKFSIETSDKKRVCLCSLWWVNLYDFQTRFFPLFSPFLFLCWVVIDTLFFARVT